MNKIHEILIKNKIFDLQIKYRKYFITYELIENSKNLYLIIKSDDQKIKRKINKTHLLRSTEEIFEEFIFILERNKE